MQSIDTRIVARSNALFGWRYGRNLVYRELMAAPSVFAAAFTSFVFPLVGLLLYFPFTRALVKRIVPKPGEGPNQYLLDNGFFKVPQDAARVLTEASLRSSHHSSSRCRFGAAASARPRGRLRWSAAASRP